MSSLERVFLLPYPPTINHYYGRRRGTNQLYIKGHGKKYRYDVSVIVRRQQVADEVREALKGPIQIEIKMTPPDARRRDVDNVQKALLDALQHAYVYVDDCQIHHLEITKLEPCSPGHVEVKIKPWTGKGE